MFTVAMFDKRVESLWKSQQRMAAARYWKTGKRAGTIRKPAAPLFFDRSMLREWIWSRVGRSAIQCPYCGVPIDILSLTIDHRTPRLADGEFALDNMVCCCKDCNQRKGGLSHQAFLSLLNLSLTFTCYDRQIFLTSSRLLIPDRGSASGGTRT